MANFSIIPYDASQKNSWDSFVDRSKNGTLLHRRDYLGYHADRFPDSSLMVAREGKLYALLPATFDGTRFSSHAGLTYGGLILNEKATTSEVLTIMEMIRDYAKETGAVSFIYRPVPHIYHRIPAEEDLYTLFRLGATLTARNVSAAIDLAHPLKFRDIRKHGIRKATQEGITVGESEDYERFWKILRDNLESRYGARPVHSLEEITHLHSLFPDRIRLHVAYKDGQAVAGTVIYLSNGVVHTQYISASPEGKATGALDLLFSTLINSDYASERYFDFGTSNEAGGHILNESLIYQKEGFGARAIIYDTYNIPLT